MDIETCPLLSAPVELQSIALAEPATDPWLRQPELSGT